MKRAGAAGTDGPKTKGYCPETVQPPRYPTANPKRILLESVIRQTGQGLTNPNMNKVSHSAGTGDHLAP